MVRVSSSSSIHERPDHVQNMTNEVVEPCQRLFERVAGEIHWIEVETRGTGLIKVTKYTGEGVERQINEHERRQVELGRGGREKICRPAKPGMVR